MSLSKRVLAADMAKKPELNNEVGVIAGTPSTVVTTDNTLTTESNIPPPGSNNSFSRGQEAEKSLTQLNTLEVDYFTKDMGLIKISAGRIILFSRLQEAEEKLDELNTLKTDYFSKYTGLIKKYAGCTFLPGGLLDYYTIHIGSKLGLFIPILLLMITTLAFIGFTLRFWIRMRYIRSRYSCSCSKVKSTLMYIIHQEKISPYSSEYCEARISDIEEEVREMNSCSHYERTIFGVFVIAAALFLVIALAGILEAE